MISNETIDLSVYIVREVKALFKNPAILWSTGKDSTAMLGIIKDALGEIPFDVVFIETGFDFPEIIEFRDRVVKEMGLRLVIAKNEKANVTYKESREMCCTQRKTWALRDIIALNKYDAVFVGIRRDEQEIRNKERYISPRDKDFRWDFNNQPLELVGWHIIFSDYEGADHVRVHPMLHWTQLDVWEYIKERNLPVNPLYFKGYTSIGCYPCSFATQKTVKSVDEIIERVKTGVKERQGRLQDSMMEKLRYLGYM